MPARGVFVLNKSLLYNRVVQEMISNRMSDSHL
ncbi:hypothetical protein [Sporosarcina sp. FSL W7-1349]